jgi:hypothetical protein
MIKLVLLFAQMVKLEIQQLENVKIVQTIAAIAYQLIKLPVLNVKKDLIYIISFAMINALMDTMDVIMQEFAINVKIIVQPAQMEKPAIHASLTIIY